MVRDKSDIKQMSDLKGKRMAWDYGGHAVTQTLLKAIMEIGGLKPADVSQVRVTTVQRRHPCCWSMGRVDATFAWLGTGTNEEANAQEPMRFLSIPKMRGERTRYLARYGGVGGKSDRPRPAFAAIPTSSATRCISSASTKVNERTVSAVHQGMVG